MQFFNSLLVVALALTTSVSGAAVASIPKAKGSVTYKAPQKITGTFDGGMKRYDRGVSCTGQSEGGDKDAVFQLADGATLKNAIIGKNQIEGVHCMGSCTIENVWWEDVCEDAITLKQKSGTSIIRGGGALHASDKVIQHNGGGVVKVQDFYVNDFGKLYRSCGNCKTQYKRTLELNGVVAINGKYLTGANQKYGDTVKITKTCAKGVKKICSRYDGNNSGAEPKELSSGPDSKVCLYKASDISSNC